MCVRVCLCMCVPLAAVPALPWTHVLGCGAVCVCVYVCVCVCMFISMCLCMCLCVYVPLAAEPALPSTRVLGCGAVCVCLCMCLCIFKLLNSVCVCVSVCVYVCVYLLQQCLPFHGHMCWDVELCVCVYVCVCVYIFISMCECVWVRVCVPLAAEPALPSTRVLGCGAVCGSWSHQDDSAVDSETQTDLIINFDFHLLTDVSDDVWHCGLSQCSLCPIWLEHWGVCYNMLGKH